MEDKHKLSESDPLGEVLTTSMQKHLLKSLQTIPFNARQKPRLLEKVITNLGGYVLY